MKNKKSRSMTGFHRSSLVSDGHTIVGPLLVSIGVCWWEKSPPSLYKPSRGDALCADAFENSALRPENEPTTCLLHQRRVLDGSAGVLVFFFCISALQEIFFRDVAVNQGRFRRFAMPCSTAIATTLSAGRNPCRGQTDGELKSYSMW
ncbi:hypothetical protein [Xanthomonas axonopodis]